MLSQLTRHEPTNDCLRLTAATSQRFLRVQADNNEVKNGARQRGNQSLRSSSALVPTTLVHTILKIR
jgi:hypothetical protein